MNTQTLSTSASLCKFVFVLPIIKPILANSRDYGFDFDEEQLAGELSAPLPIDPAIQTIPEVDSEEFETRYLWFLS